MKALGLVLPWFLVACTQPVANSSCDTTPCTGGRVCDVATRLCLANPLPRVHITTPTVNDRVSTTPVTVQGEASDNTSVTKLEYSVNAGGSWTQFPSDAGDAFSVQVALPEVDLQQLPILIRATDDFGAQGIGVVRANVDTRAPTFTVFPADGTRASDAGQVQVQFSEPVIDDANPILTPSAGAGTWSADRTRFTFPALTRGTSYAVGVPVGAYHDSFGHPVDGGTVRFYTSPAQPPPGDFSTPPDVLDFDAVSDPDGVVTVVMKSHGSGPFQYVWGRFNPGTGAFESFGSATDTGSDQLRAVANVKVNADLTTTRLSGFYKLTLAAPSTGMASWKFEPGSVQTLGSDTPGIVPLPASCAEMSGADVGLVKLGGTTNSYSRNPQSIPLHLQPQWLGGATPELWEAIGVTNGQLARERYLASCAPPATFQIKYVVFDEHVDSPANFSVALSADGQQSLYVYDSAGGRIESCHHCDGVDCNQAQTTKHPIGEHLQVASTGVGSRVLGARMKDGKVELLQRDLTAPCDGNWSTLGKFDGATVQRFVPLMIAGKPGLILLYGASAMRIAYP